MKQKHKDLLISIIEKHLPKCSIFLFGSRALENHEAESDVDLALDAGKKINLTVLYAILGDIEESSIPFFVDVVDLHGVSEDFKESIEKDFVAWKK